jgi:hypothetical protein
MKPVAALVLLCMLAASLAGCAVTHPSQAPFLSKLADYKDRP